MNNRHFDAVIAKNNLAEVVRQIANGEFTELSEIPVRQMYFDLREIEIYTGELNQPSVSDILDWSSRDEPN